MFFLKSSIHLAWENSQTFRDATTGLIPHELNDAWNSTDDSSLPRSW